MEIVFDKDLYLEERKRSYLSKRRKAYFGSRMHFFRALWENELERERDVIRDSNESLVGIDSIVHLSNNGDKFLYYPDKLFIGYNQRRYSEISFLKEQVNMDEYGYFDDTGINWHGDLGRFRIADWLPYDYSIRRKY